MTIIENKLNPLDSLNSLVSELLTTFKIRNKLALAAVLGTTSSTITDLTQETAGKTLTNQCILIKELGLALTMEKRTKAVLRASKQYKAHSSA